MALYDNHEKSARLAGYNPLYGHQLMKDPRVHAGIDYYRVLFASQSTTTPEKILYRWSLMANVNIAEMVNEDWSLKKPSDLTEAQQLALTGIEVVEKGGKRYGKPTFAIAQAQEHLGRLHKLYQEEKSKGEGLSLHISLGQQVNISTETQTQHIGHVQITTTQEHEERPHGE